MKKRSVPTTDQRRVQSVPVLIAQIAGLRQENDILKNESVHNRAYILQINHDYKILEEKYTKEKRKRDELARSHDKAIKGIEHNSKEEIIGTLKEDVTRLQTELDEKEKQIAELNSEISQLKSSIMTQLMDKLESEKLLMKQQKLFSLNPVTKWLSQVAGNKMTDGNPGVADLSDPHRPQKLVELFSILYDNKWTDAFEKSEDRGDDKTVCAYLLDLFKASWKFCKENADAQLKQLEQTLVMASDSKNQDDLYTPLSPENLKLVQGMRKTSAREMLPNLYQKFGSEKLDVKKELQPYIESCLEICWYSAINEPPLQYVFEASEQPDDFRSYTRGGKHVDFVVWPSMYLYENGPILYKGVAQFKD